MTSYKRACSVATQVVVVTILFILSVSLLAIGANLYHAPSMDTTLPLNLVETKCNVSGTVEIWQCNDGSWMPVWHSGTVLISSYERWPTEEEARALSLVPAKNATYDCLCSPTLLPITRECTAWNSCSLNVRLTRVQQWTGWILKYGGSGGIAIGSIILVPVVLWALLVLITKGYLAWCCAGTVKDSGIFVIEADED